jgi:hypothetical protein
VIPTDALVMVVAGLGLAAGGWVSARWVQRRSLGTPRRLDAMFAGMNERTLLPSSRATCVRDGAKRAPGSLALTGRRLLFMPDAGAILAVDLSRVRGVSEEPPAAVVETADGLRLGFELASPAESGEWIAALRAAIAQAEEARVTSAP